MGNHFSLALHTRTNFSDADTGCKTASRSELIGKASESAAAVRVYVNDIIILNS